MKYHSSSDAILIEGCLAGQETAWEALITKYERLIYASCRRYNLEQDEANDVFGRVCLLLLQHLPNLRHQTALSSWLLTTTGRECWHYKKHQLAGSLGQSSGSDGGGDYGQVVDAGPLPDETLIQLERQQHVREGLSQLAPRCQKLLWHLFYDPTEPSYTQIASQLNMPVSSIGPSRARCLEKLKLWLQTESD